MRVLVNVRWCGCVCVCVCASEQGTKGYGRKRAVICSPCGGLGHRRGGVRTNSLLTLALPVSAPADVFGANEVRLT